MKECPECGCSVFNEEARCLGCGWSAGRVVVPATDDLRIAFARELNDAREVVARLESVLVAAKYALRYGGGDCGDHCLNSCHWCELRRAVATAEGR